MGKGRQHNQRRNVADRLPHAASTPRDSGRAAGSILQPAGIAPAQNCRRRRGREVCAVPIVRERATGSRRVADGPDEACANRRASSLPGGGDDSSDEDEDRRDFMQQPLGGKSAAPLARASSITRPDNSSSHRHVPLPLRRPPATGDWRRDAALSSLHNDTNQRRCAWLSLGCGQRRGAATH